MGNNTTKFKEKDGDSEPTINLSLFVETSAIGDKVKRKWKSRKIVKRDDIITRNTELHRLSEAMRYFNALMMVHDEETAKTRFTDFVSSSYDAITDDFNMFVTKHSDDVLEIAEALKNGGYIDRPCTVRDCINLRRHCSRNRKAKNTKTTHDEHVEYAVNIIDKYHQMVFHLYDIGLRVNLENVVEVKEDDDGIGPDEVDKVIAAERDAIAKKKKEFAEAAPDIVEDDEENNKFVIGNTTVLKECIMDGIYREISKENESKSVEEFKCHFTENSFDSDALEYDLDDLADSDLYKELSAKSLIHSVKRLIGKIQVHRDELATGMRFKYWKNDENSDSSANPRIGRVHPKFANLKEEMLNSPFMNLEKWKTMEFKAQKKFLSKRGRAMKVTNDGHSDKRNDHFDMKKDDPIQIHHIQCVCLYTDESDLCTDFSASLRQSNGLESVDSVIERNSSYYHLSRGLSEAVQMFGVDGNEDSPCQTENGPFFTGLSKEFIISSFSILFVAPTSTSIKREIALNFAGGRGIIIQLNNDTMSSRMGKFLNVSWCSRYPAEAERLFMASTWELRMTAIILIKTATNYTRYLSAMYKLDSMLSSKVIYPLTLSAKDIETVESLCANQLDPSSSNDGNIPEYIMRCFSLWCKRKERIEINIHFLAMQFRGLSELIMDRVVGVDDKGKVKGKESLEGANILKERIFQMFSNLKKVSVITRLTGSKRLQYPIPMDTFLSFINGLDSAVKYIIYAEGDYRGMPTWLHQAVTKETEQTFEENGWKIYGEVDGNLQSLMFKKMNV